MLRGRRNPVLLTPKICLDLFWLSDVSDCFEDLAIKNLIVETNYLDRNEIAYDAGPLRPGVAGPMAIPGLFRAVLFRINCSLTAGYNSFAIRFAVWSCGYYRRR